MAKVELPLLRIRDKQPVGTLTLIRTMHTLLSDGEGRRLAVPKPVDTIIVKLVNAADEEISWNLVPMADLAGPVVVEPPDPENPEELAFQAELRGEGAGSRRSAAAINGRGQAPDGTMPWSPDHRVFARVTCRRAMTVSLS